MEEKTAQEFTATVSFNLRVTALNRGVTTGNILTGNEQPLFYDEVQIEKLRY
ncbi:hypothetical protein [Bartonella taylorii]|uniref:hypothetical protein n=1 Tax=Bartonella taylorii TaxID=33046 RepID=UPI001ABA60F9|nr:hypothetical protein [Bartonella taylorii]